MIGVFIMVGLSRFITKEYRILLSLTLCFNIAVIYGSRLYFNIAPDFDDDFSRYYQTYLDVYDNIDGAFGVYGGGFEIGLAVFYKFLWLLFPKLTPSLVLLCTALSMSILFYIWLECYGIKYVKREQRAALVSISLFIAVFFEPLDVTRQGFASIFLLYGFFAKDIRFKILFLGISLLFHLSSAYIIIGFYCLYYFPRISLCALLVFFIIFIQASAHINTYINESATSLSQFIPPNLIRFFVLYIDKNGFSGYTFIYLPIIKVILMLCILFSLYILMPRDRITHKYKAIIFASFFIYITHIFHTRITLITSELLFCFILFIVFRRYLNLALLFLFPYMLKLMYEYLSSQDKPDKAVELFFSYPEASLYPFYYLFQGVIS